ncbi:hypothetical protein D3C72_955380 [compost metagenome]
MRQVRDRLNDSLEPYGPDLIQEQGEYNRQREADQELEEADSQRVLNHTPKTLVFQEFPKVVQTHPRRLQHALTNDVFLEGDHNPVHGNIIKYKHPGYPKQSHNLKMSLGI